MKKAVLLLGFGGPESPSEVRPFLESVLEGIRIPQARFDEVLHHYDLVGGVSPYNPLAKRQAAELEEWLSRNGAPMPVRAGFRHSRPSYKDIFSEFRSEGVEDVVGIALSALRSYSSHKKYWERAEKGRAEAGAEGVRLRDVSAFYDDPLLVRAQAERVSDALASLTGRRPYVLFAAHSIPCPMAEESGYDRQFARLSELVASSLGLSDWGIAYQSRSGRPQDPWLSPDVCATVKSLDRARFDTVLVVPAGFLCENVEILYDLDIEARDAAQESGLFYARCGAVFGHPSFTELLGRRVLDAFSSP